MKDKRLQTQFAGYKCGAEEAGYLRLVEQLVADISGTWGCQRPIVRPEIDIAGLAANADLRMSTHADVAQQVTRSYNQFVAQPRMVEGPVAEEVVERDLAAWYRLATPCEIIPADTHVAFS